MQTKKRDSFKKTEIAMQNVPLRSTKMRIIKLQKIAFGLKNMEGVGEHSKSSFRADWQSKIRVQKMVTVSFNNFCQIGRELEAIENVVALWG